MFNPGLFLHFVLADCLITLREKGAKRTNNAVFKPPILKHQNFCSDHSLWSCVICLVVPVSLNRDGSFILHLQLSVYKLLPGHTALPKEVTCNCGLCLEVLSPCQSWSHNSLSCGGQINPFAKHLCPRCSFENKAYSENFTTECRRNTQMPLTTTCPSTLRTLFEVFWYSKYSTMTKLE